MNQIERSNIRKRRRQQHLRKLWIRRIIILGIIPLCLIVGGITLLRAHFLAPSETETISEDSTIDSTATSEDIITSVTIDSPEVDDTTSVTFLAVGDNIGHLRVIEYADANSGVADDGLYDFTPIYTYVEDYIQEADIAYINQETIIGGDDLGITGYPIFNSPEQWAYDLATVGFDVVNGCTNHTFDKGIDALEYSIQVFDQIPSILYVGVYDSEEAANTVQTMEVNGITFSFLSYTTMSNVTSLPNDYCIKFFDEETIRTDVANAKEVSDVIIVSAHWGVEGSTELNTAQTTYAQLFADLEVDVVVGHHPHVIQSIEWITGENGNETLVAYSLGNFTSTMDSIESQLEGMLTLEFIKTDEGISVDNVALTPLVNHFDGDVVNVYPLSEYTDELNAEHYKLATLLPNAIEYYESLITDLIDAEFLIS